jgi:hypothetical protein
MPTRLLSLLIASLVFGLTHLASASPRIDVTSSADSHAFILADGKTAANVAIDRNDFPLIEVAAGMFADDVQRVVGIRPAISEHLGSYSIIVGTLGHSSLVDTLAKEGKLQHLDEIKNRWEGTLWQVVNQPFPGVDQALVIVGSDRRGAAYGLMEISRKIGVSPWYWWADVPVKHAQALALKLEGAQWDVPAVRYRGIFINDEDWGLNPWAAKTFESKLGNIGPKTYAKVFELMLRLRLNYLWPAMHACSAEFDSHPENIELADRFGIVMGSSHCEPMLCNNVHWDEATRGKWDYTLNRDAIYSYWENAAKTRGQTEAVWTLGIRGIHDRAMEGPNVLSQRIDTVTQVLKDQRSLLNQYVSKQWGPIAQCFVPYKEVLPIYDAGLKVPDDVTLVWVDDNFGYIRRLSAPAERTRSGGAGVYWHLSYYGGPHSYTWINTTAPALIWEEFHKAWENEARTLWIINVGDIKPMEIGIDYFSKLAWSADTFGPDSQPSHLREFARENLGANLENPVAELLTQYYHLGTIRKPELMDRNWALSLTSTEAANLETQYRDLVERTQTINGTLLATERDAFFETVGFPADVLGKTGLIFMADRNIQKHSDATTNARLIDQLRAELTKEVGEFNDTVANGKWKFMMPGLVTGKNLSAWSSQVRWPWGETGPSSPEEKQSDANIEQRHWRAAADIDGQSGDTSAHWTEVPGLGTSGKAIALEPAGIESAWAPENSNAPFVRYDFDGESHGAEIWIDFLPIFRLYPGMKARVALSIDHEASQIVEVPGSSGAEDERGEIRREAVQSNYVRARIPFPTLSKGKHTLTIRAIDPGVVIDRLSLP